MNVKKRNGKLESVRLDKITERIKKLKYLFGHPLQIDETLIAAKVVSGLYDGVSTADLDTLAAETAAMMSSYHPDYDTLAARITISNLHKETPGDFAKVIEALHHSGTISKEYAEYVSNNAPAINSLVDYNLDYNLDYFGVKTLQKSYLLKGERPQDLWMRVASFIHREDWKKVQLSYHGLSNKIFIHATPTLFNSGTIRPQLSSCFLLDISADSIDGIYKSLSDCAKISQSAGGIGLSVHKIRSTGSNILGTGGNSNGIVPMLRVFDATARYVDQGGGKRKGSIAIYIEPWHSDIFEFLDLKKNNGKEEIRARDLFYGLWIPDLFMQRVQDDAEWTLFDPKETPELIEAVGERFNQLYLALEKLQHGESTNPRVELRRPNAVRCKSIKARDLWDRIITSQIETGTPYMLYKDAANLKSNQQNLGTIKSSNLCTEIIEYTSPEEIAVCNLSSLSLPAFVNETKTDMDYEKIIYYSGIVTENLNKVIDATYYPVAEARTSNLRHRPIGIGVQGLADVFAILKLSFDCEEAKKINKKIFEAIYKGSVDKSIELARKDGAYETYEGSPASNGRLQFHLWGLDESQLNFGWADTLRNLGTYGLRNSLLLAPMPTASTSQILGNNECFEPFTSNIYTRRTLAGEFIVVNRHLIKELIELGLWNNQLRNELIKENGSVSGLKITDDLKQRYRTVWEIPQRSIIDMAAERGPFICQSQSMNLFFSDLTAQKLTSAHFYGWKKGLKTGSYYIRSTAARDAIKFTVNNEKEIDTQGKEEITQALQSSEIWANSSATCSIDDSNCEACSA